MLISMKANLLLHSFSILELDPGLSVTEAALQPYEREEGPMPYSVSCVKTPIN